MGTNARANSHLQPIDLDSNSQSEPYISGKTNKKNKTIKTDTSASIEGFMSNSINTSVDAVSKGIESIAELKDETPRHLLEGI